MTINFAIPEVPGIVADPKCMRFRCVKCLTVSALALLAGSLPVHAKSLDLSAHFESENYWSNHSIYRARITDIKNPSDGNRHYVTTFRAIEIISGIVDATNEIVQSDPGRMDFAGPTGEQSLEFPLGVSPGSEILVCENTRYHQVTIVKVLQFPDDQALLVVLKRIAGLRKAPTLQSLLGGATSEFDLESEYCLNRLLTLSDTTIPEIELKKLQSVANDDERPPDLRIAAEEAELKFSGTPEPDRSDAEYHWLEGAIHAARTNFDGDVQSYMNRMRPLAYKLPQFKAKRGEAADYLLRLVADPTVPAGLRCAACSALSGWDQQVFDFQSPDKRFDHMFDIYLALLRDKDPDLRIEGVSMLFDRTLTIMSTQSPPQRAAEYARRAVQALQNAIDRETDSRVMLFFKSRMEIYKDRQAHPEFWNQMRELEMGGAGTNGRNGSIK